MKDVTLVLSKPGLDGRPRYKISGVPGWQGYTFERVQVALRDGRPVLLGIAVRYVGEGDAPVLTAERLAKIPASKLARLVAESPYSPFASGVTRVFAALEDLGASESPNTLPDRPRKGSPEFHRAVLEIYDAARSQGRSGIRAITQAAQVQPDTAKKYSSEAHRWAREQTETNATTTEDDK